MVDGSEPFPIMMSGLWAAVSRSTALDTLLGLAYIGGGGRQYFTGLPEKFKSDQVSMINNWY